MELEHSFTVPVPRDRAWDVLLDVERVAPCMPGATIDSIDGDEIHGRIKVKVGPINMTYAGTARFVEKDKATGVVQLEASGKETRGAGTATASVRSVLKDHGDQTDVVVLTTLNVTGKPAQFGRGVMNEVGGKLLSIFAANLAATLAEPAPDAAQAAATAGAAGAAEAAEAAGAAEAEARVDAAEAGAAAGGADVSATVHPGLDATVDDLQLPARVSAALRRQGITSVTGLAARTRQELLAIDGIGPASVDDIAAKLADRGLTLGQQAAPVAIPAGAVPSQPTGETALASPPASTPPMAEATGGGVSRNVRPATAREAAHQLEDDAINLIKVAGMPMLKRALPVLAGLTAALLIAMRRKLRHRNR